MADQNKQSDNDTLENESSEKKEIPGGSSTGQASGGAETGQASGGAETGQASGGAETGQASGGAETGQASGGAETVQASGGAESGQASGGAETVQASGGAEMVSRVTYRRYDSHARHPSYDVDIADPGERYGRQQNQATADATWRRTVPTEHVPGVDDFAMIDRLPMRHVIVRTEQGPLQETDRQDDRRMRRNDRNAIPFERRFSLRTYWNFFTSFGGRLACCIFVVVILVIILIEHIVNSKKSKERVSSSDDFPRNPRFP